MAWLQFSIDLSIDDIEAAEESLLNAGAISITLQDGADQPILEPGVNQTPLWSATRLVALFDIDGDSPTLATQSVLDKQTEIAEIFQHQQSISAFEILGDKDWEREWLQHFKPINCGKRLWICPGWQRPAEGGINLLLDPGLAFGTGTHETTFMCLEWLDGHNVEQQRAIDFGCGSGILGIAALLLGAEHVTFIDNDPQAVTATRENLRKNDVDASRYSLLLAEEFERQSDTQPLQVDLLLANILAGPLISLATTISDCVLPSGNLVLSGILEDQADGVMQAYLSHFRFEPPINNNGWVCLTANKRPHS